MSTFKVQIEDLIGSVGDDDLITDSLLSVGAEIIESTSPAKLIKFADESTISTSGLDVSNRKVLEVHIGNYKAKYVNYADIAPTKDSGSIYFSATTDPVYYFTGEKVFGLIGNTITESKLLYVPTQPTGDGTNLIAHGSSSTMFFPLEAEKLMVLGAAARCLKRTIADQINTDEDVELAQMSLAQLQALEASYDKELQKYLT